MSTFVIPRLRRLRDFPMCVVFLIFTTCRSLAVLTLFQLGARESHLQQIYLGRMAEVLLAAAVFHELNRNVFRQFPGLRQLGGLLFRWLAVVIVVVAAIGAASSAGSDLERLLAGLRLLYACSLIGAGGLLIYLFFFADYFGMSPRQLLAGILLGLAIFLALGLVERAWFPQFAPLNVYPSRWRTVILDSSILIWLVFLTSPSRDAMRRPASRQMETWNSRLQEFLAR